MLVLSPLQKAVLTICIVANVVFVARVLWPPASVAPRAVTQAAKPPAATVLVHVAGRVKRPGVYRLPATARVYDAVKAAGGPFTDTALDQLNLAAPVSDGTQIRVEAVGSGAATGLSGSARHTGKATPAPHSVDANTTEPAVLQQLPGVGAVTARRIVEYRNAHGRYRRPADLEAVPGIGPKTVARLTPYLRF